MESIGCNVTLQERWCEGPVKLLQRNLINELNCKHFYLDIKRKRLYLRFEILHFEAFKNKINNEKMFYKSLVSLCKKKFSFKSVNYILYILEYIQNWILKILYSQSSFSSAECTLFLKSVMVKLSENLFFCKKKDFLTVVCHCTFAAFPIFLSIDVLYFMIRLIYVYFTFFF